MPHDDPMVVELKVANMKVRRILIDTGSSSDIINLSYLKNLKCDEKSVEPVSHPLVGFGGGIIYPVGRVDLPIRVGEKGKSRSLFVRFLVVDDLTAYKIILGRPTLNEAKALIAPHLMLMKYECNDGRIGAIYGDQRIARECYLTTVRSTVNPKEVEAPPTRKRKAAEENQE